MCDVARDVYSRGQYKRFTHSNLVQWEPHFTCDWCGNRPNRIYGYVWYCDSQRTPTVDNGRWFCDLDCLRAYHS